MAYGSDERKNNAGFMDHRNTHLTPYNVQVSNIEESEGLVLSASDRSDQLVGGITGTLWGRCLEIDYLWVSDQLRGQGLGSRILTAIEKLARDRHCKVISLETFSFQAPEFYIKHGYVEKHRVEGYSDGDVVKHFFTKELQ